MSYVRYSEDLESRRPDEDELIDKMIKVLHGNNEYAFKKYHHGIRDAHAKSHGILGGELTVYPDLPDELRQGLFATPATYPVIARLSTTAGAIRSDQIRGVHGLGIKVLGAHGPRVLPDDTATTQDFVLVTHREFPYADVHAYYVHGMPMAWLLARLPDPALKVITNGIAGAGKVLGLVGLSLPDDSRGIHAAKHSDFGRYFLFVGATTLRRLRREVRRRAIVEIGDIVARPTTPACRGRRCIS